MPNGNPTESTSTRLSRAARCAAAIVLVAAGLCHAQPQIIDIGTAAGGPDSFIASLSNDGAAAAVTCNCSPQRALRWTAAGGLVALPQGAGAASSNSFGISGNGAREGGSVFLTALSGRVPTYWIGTTGPFTFSLPGGFTQGSINAASDNGTYFVGSLTNSLSGPTTACRLSTSGPHVTIPVPGFGSSVAIACSGDGQRITGTASTPGNRAFRWDSGTLTLLPLPAPAVEMRGFAMSHDGTMVAGGAVLPANVHRAFAWTAAGGPALLDTTDPSLETQATVVTSDRSVVFGNSVYTVPTGGALVWVDGQPGIFLRDYLAAAGLDTTGWRLDAVAGISLDGRTLAGSGLHNGQTRGFVITNLPSVCAPVIATQPDPIVVNAGASATFSVAAGPSSVTYQWFHDAAGLVDGPTGTGSEVFGAATASVTILNVGAADGGDYWCMFNNACGGAISNPASLTVNAGCGTQVESIECGATCTGEGQECGLLFEVVRDTCGDLRVEYTTALTHCSNVGMKFFVDGTLVAQTPPVGPGVSTGEIDLGPVTPGPHTLGMEGVGEEGGCNTGFLEDWAGTLRLTYCVAQPVFEVQPQPDGACPTGSVGFVVSVSGGGPSSLSWQISDPTVVGEWRDIVDGDTLAGSGRVAFTASGAGTSALTISFGPGFTDDWAAESAEIRCAASNACGSVTSDTAALRWCFANCDCSAASPTLNVLDFACFLNRYAAGDPYANCDGSTTPPVLNVLDFACFLNRFATGCP